MADIRLEEQFYNTGLTVEAYDGGTKLEHRTHKRAMTFVIVGACVDVRDASCLDVCPVDCIYDAPEPRMLVIHPDECIDCGACVPACPVEAIFPLAELPARWSEYAGLNACAAAARRAAHELLDS